MKGTVRQTAASVIPYYNFFEDQLLPLLHGRKQADLGKKTDETAVDQGEIKSSYSNLNSQLGGTLNPFKFTFNLLRRLFGNSRQDRVQTELKQLQQYSGLYDNYLFANDSLKFLKTKIHQQISQKEGIPSKLGLWTNKKVAADPIVSELKTTFKSWLVPFEQILSGGVKGVSLYKADVDFLQELANDLLNGNHSEYLKDLANDVNSVLQKILKQQNKQLNAQKASQAPSSQLPRNSNTSRQAAEQLASLAA